MSAWSVNIVSAFGRGETLATALQESGFQVRILDFTSAFTNEYQRGAGPFPVIDKSFFPAQRELLDEAETQEQGLTFWLKDGPIELIGPLAPVHIHTNPGIQAWKTNSSSGGFDRTWLQHFLRQWAAPYFSESWDGASDPLFPAELPLGNFPTAAESKLHGFLRARAKNIEVIAATAIRDVQISNARLTSIEVEAGPPVVHQATQWIWCLSSMETESLSEAAAFKVFGREVIKPEWAWLSFAGTMSKGPWTAALPQTTIVIGDVYLPWYYANVAIVRRSDESHYRIWIKVPRSRVGDIDARRGWAGELQRLMNQRLALAGWKIDSANWNLCPHSEIFAGNQRGQRINQYRNWNLITPEVLPRLDLSARLQMEAEAYNRLTQWRNQETKKQGGRRDPALHAP